MFLVFVLILFSSVVCLYLYYYPGVQREVVSIALSFSEHTTVAFGAASYRMDGDKMFSIQAQESLFVVFKVSI